MAKADFCEKLSERCLLDSPDTGGVPVLTELWRRFDEDITPQQAEHIDVLSALDDAADAHTCPST